MVKFLVRLGREQDAVPYFKEALQRNPKGFIAWEEWIGTLQQLQGVKRAQAASWEWMPWEPLEPKAWKALGYTGDSSLPWAVSEVNYKKVMRVFR
jgi:uncharacterized protein HemY